MEAVVEGKSVDAVVTVWLVVSLLTLEAAPAVIVLVPVGIWMLEEVELEELSDALASRNLSV